MKFFKIFLVLLMCNITFSCKSDDPQPTPKPDEGKEETDETQHFEANGYKYDIIFSDEFNAPNSTQPSSDKWIRCPRRTSTWNRWCSDRPEVAYQENGELILKAIPNPGVAGDDAPMITGGIESTGKFSFKYGRVECRAKVMNLHAGNFPAIWMMPENPTVGWPACGEIDIFEQIDDQNVAYHTIHTNWTYTLGNKMNPQSSFNEVVHMSYYHTYAFEWDADQLRWYVDGVLKGKYDRKPELAEQGQWPFDQNFHLILNQSVGNGSWAANADTNHTYQMNIDWIRVYKMTKK